MLTALETILIFAAGAALAWLFCWHLNWCLQRLHGVSSPFGFWSLHWLIRMGGVLAGFYWIGSGDAARLMVCLVGFVMTRLMLTRNAAQPAPTAPSFK